jgi:hypothetical protein
LTQAITIDTPLDGMTLAEIEIELAHCTVTLTDTKARAESLQSELRRRYASLIGPALDPADGKAALQAVIETNDPSLALRVERRRTVKWDQPKMMQIARSLPWDQAAHWIDFDLSIAEKKFNAMPPGELREGAIAARSVNYSEPKIAIVPRET